MRTPIVLIYLFIFFSFISCEQEVDPRLLPVISTTEVTEISYYSVKSGGMITQDGGFDVIARGVCWSTSPNPTIDKEKSTNDAGTGAFVSTIDKLIPNTTYFLRAYATNKKGTSYGLQVTFSTMPLTVSELVTTQLSAISTTSAQTGGTITIDGGTAVIARGVCWSTLPAPTINDSITLDGTGVGTYTSLLSRLKTGTAYYVRAYATNAQGTSYGNELNFMTQTAIAEVTTSAVESITTSSASSGGNVSHDGGSNVIARGICFHTTPNPTIANSKTTNGSGSGSFTSALTGLKSGSIYYMKAYATNSVGTAYGSEISFTTLLGVPELTTIALSSITRTSAVSGGNITHDGGAAIIERGVCWSTTPSPTVEDNFVRSGSGSGNFTSSVTGLQAGTKYYLRSYATNSVGTSYGNTLSFFALNVGDAYNAATGKIWMDRNLGAHRVASSNNDAEGYGDMYQWGRNADGHEKRTSSMTFTLSNIDNPGHGYFISTSSGNNDWRNTQNNNLWQGLNGTNNPCPDDYRLPTTAEWEAERASWTSNNITGAFGSPLKLPAAGYRSFSNGALLSVGFYGDYWSSTVSGTGAQTLYFSINEAYQLSNYRAYGLSVRCIKD